MTNQPTLKGIRRDEFLKYFRYDRETGDLIKLPREGRGNRREHIVSSRTFHGYVKASLNRISFVAHRIIWFMEYGTVPDKIDHINGDPADNRMENLRECTQAENLRNTAIRRDNKSGWKGVSRTTDGRWVANVNLNGKVVWSARFSDVREAAEERMFAALRIHGEFARLG